MENTRLALEQSSRPGLARRLGLVLAGALALYLVGRGVAEFLTIDYSDPAGYASSWGGPSCWRASSRCTPARQWPSWPRP